MTEEAAHVAEAVQAIGKGYSELAIVNEELTTPTSRAGQLGLLHAAQSCH